MELVKNSLYLVAFILIVVLTVTFYVITIVNIALWEFNPFQWQYVDIDHMVVLRTVIMFLIHNTMRNITIKKENN